MSGLMSDFKSFIMRGNIIDMTAGIVIGVAFGNVVKGFVSNIIMPPVGLAIGGIDFSKLKWVIQAAGADGKGGVAIEWGAFINLVITFLIIALVVFLLIRTMSKIIKKAAEAPEAPAADVVLLTEIRDLLKDQRSNA